MSLKRMTLAALGSVALAACSHTQPPPAITLDDTAFHPAHEVPAIAPTIAPVSVLNASSIVNLSVPSPERSAPAVRVSHANAAALQEPHSDAYLNATQVYAFSDGALYKLFAAPQQVSDIVLEPGETLSAISAGDTVRWAVGDTSSGGGSARQVHVMVKPFTAGLTTNLVILTNKRTYHLVLESTAHAAMAALRWSYPNEDLVAAKAAADAAPVDTGLNLEALNFRYAVSGDAPPWRPLRAFDDGHKVFIEFPARFDQGEAPPLFVVNAAGGNDLVNYRVRGNYYVVDHLFAAAELRLGTDPQQVVRISRSDGAAPAKGVAGIFGGSSP